VGVQLVLMIQMNNIYCRCLRGLSWMDWMGRTPLVLSVVRVFAMDGRDRGRLTRQLLLITIIARRVARVSRKRS
jgi:hypothetical protein